MKPGRTGGLGVTWQVAPEAWEEALAACPGATAFHTAAWLDAMQASFGATPVRARFSFPDGEWALAALSLRHLGRGLLPLAIAGETGVYGGVLAPRPLAPDRVATVLAALRRRHGSVRIFGNPFVPGGGPLPAGDGWQPLPQSTHVLSLGPLEDLRPAFSRGCKARGNKARRLGVTVAWRKGPEAVDIFEPLYRDSVRRWGERLTWARPRAFFDAVMAMPGNVAELAVATQGGEPIAAMLFLRRGALVHYLAGATREAALPACPSNALMEAAIARYAELGAQVLDMGASNGLPGVEQFKASFGARPRPFAGVEALSWPLGTFLACREWVPPWLARRRGAQPQEASA